MCAQCRQLLLFLLPGGIQTCVCVCNFLISLCSVLHINNLVSIMHVPHAHTFAVMSSGSHIIPCCIDAVQYSVASFELKCIPSLTELN